MTIDAQNKTAQKDVFAEIENSFAENFKVFGKMADTITAKEPRLADAMGKMTAFLKAANDEMPIEGGGAGFSRWFTAILVLAETNLNEGNVEALQRTAEDAAHLAELMPELKKAINEYKFKNKLKSLPFDTVARVLDEHGNTRSRSLFNELRERAEALASINKGLLISEKTVLPKSAAVTLDNVNKKIWRHSYDPAEAKEAGLFEISALTSYINKQDHIGPINTICTIDFNKLGKNVALTRKLNEFDEQVYLAVASLYKENKLPNSEYVYISVTQIYYAMGGISRPNDTDRKKIFDSLSKMMFTRLTINNDEEAANTKYKPYPYSGPLLVADFMPCSKIINGRQIEQPIRIMALPSLYAYAAARKQVTHFNPAARAIAEISNTPQNIALREFLLRRIAHAKKGHAPCTIILNSLFEYLKIKNRSQQLRLVKDTADRAAKLPIILNHFKKLGIICGYDLNEKKLDLFLKNEIQAEPVENDKKQL